MKTLQIKGFPLFPSNHSTSVTIKEKNQICNYSDYFKTFNIFANVITCQRLMGKTQIYTKFSVN